MKSSFQILLYLSKLILCVNDFLVYAGSVQLCSFNSADRHDCEDENNSVKITSAIKPDILIAFYKYVERGRNRF